MTIPLRLNFTYDANPSGSGHVYVQVRVQGDGAPCLYLGAWGATKEGANSQLLKRIDEIRALVEAGFSGQLVHIPHSGTFMRPEDVQAQEASNPFNRTEPTAEP